MNPSTMRSRIARALLVAVVVPLAALPFVAVASAAPGGTATNTGGTATATEQPGHIVVLGDSFAANNIDISGCGQSPTAWPQQLADLTSRPLINEACSGASLAETEYTIADEAIKAEERGGFTDSAAAILIQLGMNGPWEGSNSGGEFVLECLVENGCDNTAPLLAKITPQAYAAKVGPVIEYVRYYAPNAKIAIVGYPELVSADDPNGCINVAGVPVTVPNTSGIGAFTERLQLAQVGAAELTGVEFIDTQAISAGQGACSIAPLVNGVLNPQANLFGIPVHPTPQADAALAKLIAGQLDL